MQSAHRAISAPTLTGGVYMKCTGPLDVIPNGKLLMDEEGNGKIFSIKEKRRNMDWTLISMINQMFGF